MINFKDITLGHYIYRDSFLHRLDPRMKLILLLVQMVFILLMNQFIMMPLLALLIIFYYHTARLSVQYALKSMRPFYILFILTMLMHAFFAVESNYIRLPLIGLKFSPFGFLTGVFYSFRIICLIAIAHLLTLTTSPMSLTDAIENLLKPFHKLGIPAHDIAMMLSIALRFIPIMIEEADRIQKAQLSRGGALHGRFINKLKGLIPLLIPLFMSTFRRAHDLALAMESRCYRGGQGRTRLYELKYTNSDMLAAGFTAGAALIFLLLWYL